MVGTFSLSEPTIDPPEEGMAFIVLDAQGSGKGPWVRVRRASAC